MLFLRYCVAIPEKVDGPHFSFWDNRVQLVLVFSHTCNRESSGPRIINGRYVEYVLEPK
jgi:hypothetical protein